MREQCILQKLVQSRQVGMPFATQLRTMFKFIVVVVIAVVAVVVAVVVVVVAAGRLRECTAKTLAGGIGIQTLGTATWVCFDRVAIKKFSRDI